MPLQWTCEKCGAINIQEISAFNRYHSREKSTCSKCGAENPDGWYATV